MLIRVIKPKLVLGRSVYQRGDIFECPVNEAMMMRALNMSQEAPAGAVATREPPIAPRGLRLKPGHVSYMPTRARKIAGAAAEA